MRRFPALILGLALAGAVHAENQIAEVVSMKMPAKPIARGERGEVELFYLVSPTGEPFEISIVHTTNQRLIPLATATLKNSTIQPALRDGRPTHGALNTKISFFPADMPGGARKRVARAYGQLSESIKADQQERAQEQLEKLTKLDARGFGDLVYQSLGEAEYEERWGTPGTQAAALRQTSSYLERAEGIADAERTAILWRVFVRELESRNYMAARSTWAHIDRQADLFTQERLASGLQAVAAIDEMRADTSSYTASGILDTNGSWHRQLLKRTFTLQAEQGALSNVLLKCDFGFLRVDDPSGLPHQVPAHFGNCWLVASGEPGAAITLEEF